MILICTDNGEMLLCANNGEYKSYILESPLGKPINTVYSFSNGFVVCERNNFLIFQSEDGDERALLRQDGPPIPILMNDNSSSSQLGSQPPSIISLVANEDESEIYAITSHGQMITARDLIGAGGSENGLMAGSKIKVVDQTGELVAILNYQARDQRLNYCCVFAKQGA